MKTIHLYFDGGTVHGSFKVYYDSIKEECLRHHQVYEMDGIGDSNQAEFTVLLRALRWLHINTPDISKVFLKVYGDCSTVHTTITKNQVSTREVYNYLAERIRERLTGFGGYKYTRVNRVIIKEMLGH